MIRAPPRSTRPDTLLPYPTLFLSAEAVVLLRRGRSEEALALLARSRNPVAQVVAQAIQGRQRRELPEAVVREEVLRSGNEAIEGLRTHLSALERIGSVAPLLGLFGTVLGMNQAFPRLSEAGQSAQRRVGKRWVSTCR